MADFHRRLLTGDAEVPLNLQPKLHPVEAVQSELVEVSLGLLFLVGQRPMHAVREDVQDSLAHLGLDVLEIKLGGLRRRREVERAPTTKEMVAYPCRFLGLAMQVAVVPLLQPRVERLAAQLGKLRAIDDLNGHLDTPP